MVTRAREPAGALRLVVVSTRPEAGLAGSGSVVTDAGEGLAGPAAASVRPEAKLAGSVSAWAEVLDVCLTTAEEGGGLAGDVRGVAALTTPTRFWLEPNPRPLASLLRHSSPAQAQISRCKFLFPSTTQTR